MYKISSFVVAIMLFFSISLFSGCILPDSEESSEEGNVKIVEYNVTTYWSIGNSFSREDYSEPGFYHDIPKDANPLYTYYKISGIVKNVAGKMLKQISINAIFYDANGTELFRSGDLFDPLFVQGDTIYDLPSGYSESFNIIVHKQYQSTCKYFDKVTSFKFIISTSE